jgi:hypothetical protein
VTFSAIGPAFQVYFPKRFLAQCMLKSFPTPTNPPARTTAFAKW